jgi:hypothetical protein
MAAGDNALYEQVAEDLDAMGKVKKGVSVSESVKTGCGLPTSVVNIRHPTHTRPSTFSAPSGRPRR